MRRLLCALLSLCAPALAAQSAFLNPSFDGDGIASPAVGTTSSALDALLGDDGGVLLAGEIDVRAGLVKLQPNGALDETFGTSGAYTFSFENRTSFASDVDRLDGGDLLVVGSASTTNQSDIGFGFAARLSPTGVLRPTFGTNGVTRIGEGPGFSRPAVVDAEVLNDGRILIAASARDAELDQIIVLALLQANGSLDTTFGTDGIAIIDAPVLIEDAQLLTDGRLILSGYLPTRADGSRADAALLAVTSAGTVDTSFGTGGVARLDLSGDFNRFREMGLASDGKIIVAGTAGGNGTASEAVVARYTTSGTLDNTFGSGGLARISGTDTRGADVSVLSDDRVVLVGTENGTSVLVAQLTSAGAPDASFAPNGKAAFPLGTGVFGVASAIYSDGDILAAGYTYTNGNQNESSAVALRVTSGPVADEGSPEATSGLRLDVAGAHPAAQVRLSLSLEETTPVRIDVYDARGRLASTVFDGTLPTGEHTFDSPAGLSPGTYIVRAVTRDGQTVARPVVVLR